MPCMYVFSVLDVAALLLKAMHATVVSARRGGACPLPYGSPQGAPLHASVVGVHVSKLPRTQISARHPSLRRHAKHVPCVNAAPISKKTLELSCHDSLELSSSG